jgi:hypothetical protein
MKLTFQIIGGFAGLLLVVFILEAFGLGMFAFFEPKRENIRREVYEQTKSRVEGVVQDLGKYYREYQEADGDGKKIIENTVQMRFGNFDAELIDNYKLKSWFISIRGY